MSDTPRTEEEIKRITSHLHGDDDDFEYAIDQLGAHARELERDLAAAIKQRDKARREVCELLATISQTTSRPTKPLNIANWRGWDCFDREEVQP
jgi:hypothetical protein